MNNKLALAILLLLTVLMSAISGDRIFLFLLIVIGAIKFVLVAFQYMEVKQAHVFWKLMMILFSGILFTLMYMLKY